MQISPKMELNKKTSYPYNHEANLSRKIPRQSSFTGESQLLWEQSGWEKERGRMQSMKTFGRCLNGKFLLLLLRIPESVSERWAGPAPGHSLLDNGNFCYEMLQINVRVIFFWTTSCSYSGQINQNTVGLSPYPAAWARYQVTEGASTVLAANLVTGWHLCVLLLPQLLWQLYMASLHSVTTWGHGLVLDLAVLG